MYRGRFSLRRLLEAKNGVELHKEDHGERSGIMLEL
jgi:hypothetical protein